LNPAPEKQPDIFQPELGKYLFSWEKVPGNDGVKLIDFLKKNYGVDWVEEAQIHKSDDGKTIRITAEKNILSLSLNDENADVNLIIDDVRTYKFIVKKENGELNIYPVKVKIVEFMKFDCIHCYNLHKDTPRILEKYGDRVQILYVPIVFRGQSTKSIEAYIIAEQMSKAEEMRDALFKAKFVDNLDVMESTITLENVASSIGLGEDFNSKLEGNDARELALSNLAFMNKYAVESTPAVYINGKRMVDPPIIENLDAAIGSLLG
jgi:protein-disulfide isomerase